MREASPTAPRTTSFGSVSFLHRFGSSLNPHYHYHLCVVDGLFEKIEGDSAPDPATNSGTHLRFRYATALTHELLERLQHTIRHRVLRQFIELSFASFDGLAGHLLGALRAVISRAARLRRHGLLEPHEAEDFLTWDCRRGRITTAEHPGQQYIHFVASGDFIGMGVNVAYDHFFNGYQDLHDHYEYYFVEGPPRADTEFRDHPELGAIGHEDVCFNGEYDTSTDTYKYFPDYLASSIGRTGTDPIALVPVVTKHISMRSTGAGSFIPRAWSLGEEPMIRLI